MFNAYVLHLKTLLIQTIWTFFSNLDGLSVFSMLFAQYHMRLSIKVHC